MFTHFNNNNNAFQVTLPQVLFCQHPWEASLGLDYQLRAAHTGRP